MLTKVTITCIFCLLTLKVGWTKDLGQMAHTFSIVEQNMLSFIDERLHFLERTGELKKIEEKAKADVMASILRPKPVGLGTTDTPKTFYYTPTFTLKEAVYDAKGNLIYPKGTTVNPMDARGYPPLLKKYAITLPKWQGHLLFFNGDDIQQLNWLNKKLATLNAQHQSYKLVMTGGHLKETIKATNSKVYFDQYGKLSQQFGLKHVPVMITQSETSFKIQEFSVSQESLKLALKEVGASA
jgi:conjugal transfer pilus assembly protein TraW